MDFLQRITSCSSDEVEQLVNERIDELNSEAITEDLGVFMGGVLRKPHQGFISLDSRIKFCSTFGLGVESYNMNSRDYLIEFCRFLNNNHINNNNGIIRNLASYADWYFGGLQSHDDYRGDYLTSLCHLDEDGFPDEEDVKNISIDKLRNKGIAQCTEKAAITQNILSLFGIDSYYCCGALNVGDNSEFHSFNIVRSQDGYRILDTSRPIVGYHNEQEYFRRPYASRVLTEEEFSAVLQGEQIFECTDYEVRDGKRVDIGTRRYGVNYTDEALKSSSK